MLGKAPISPPLPLPLRFTLLPSLLPSRSLVPLLYSQVNGLPVYLTLSPSHSPHVSFMPLLLALSTTPLEIVKSLPPDGISLDLAGAAPFVDIWVPILVARALCEKLGLRHLFQLEGKQGGLFGEEAEHMISWEEDGCICHNWIPSSIYLPPSAYSLETLLSTSFGHASIIPEERCITTPIDRDRKARLLAAGELDDPSHMRSGEWGLAWEECLRWTHEAWKGYSAHPSRPPKDHIDHDHLSQTIHHLLPRLAALSGANQAAYPLSRVDIAAIINFNSVPDPSIYELLKEIFRRLARHLPSGTGDLVSRADRVSLERRARVQLGLVEIIGSQLVQSFTRDRISSNSDLDIRHMERPDSPVHTQDDSDDKSSRSSSHSAPSGLSHRPRRRRVAAHPSAPHSRPTTGSTQLPEPPDMDRSSHTWTVTLQSEAVDGWWIYISVAGSIVIAIVLGLLPL